MTLSDDPTAAATSSDPDDTSSLASDPLGELDGDEQPWWALHVGLFLASCAVTFLAGMYFAEVDPFQAKAWQQSAALLSAAGYMACVMAILFAHEMGHYLQAKRHGVIVSPPYFIPGVPIPFAGVVPLMGTFGAFIRMQMRPMRAKPLLEIGAWGPLAGFALTVPTLLLGYALSEVRPLAPPDAQEAGAVLTLGNSLLMGAATALFFPEVPEGHDVFLHPVAMAGWTGGFLTAYNLLPFGQLDGGHIAYTVFGDRFNRLVPWLFAAFVVLGVVGFSGWLLLAALIAWIGVRHPPIVRGELVRGKDAWLAWASLAMFAVTFTPQPIVMPQSLLGYLLELF